MKTSNKLLIGFAVLCFLIPMIVMSVYIKANYRERTSYKEPAADLRFRSTSDGMASVPITASFTSLRIADAKWASFSIQVLRDTETGIKLSEENKKLLSWKVNEKGELLLSIISDAKELSNKHFFIKVYVKELMALDVSSANTISLGAMTDSMKISLNNVARFGFQPQNSLKAATISAVGTQHIDLAETSIRSLNIDLDNSELICQSSLDYLSVSGSGASIELSSRGSSDMIKKCVLNTKGTSTVTIENIAIEDLSGSISDETLAKMPVKYVKLLVNR